jgi:hypothetical protein
VDKEEVRVLTVAGMLGYGLDAKEVRKGLEMRPDVITADSGSTDSGPQKLGAGQMVCPADAYYKDISLMLEAGHDAKIPVYISSAGGDGTNAHVDMFLDMVKEISKAKGYRFNIAAIYADIDRNYIKNKIRAGKVNPCGPLENLTEDEVNAATNIVAQMGVEPFQKAVQENDHLDIIISGRTYDPVPAALLGINAGFNPGLCWHMGKIVECGALCAEPAGKSVFGIVRPDYFTVEPVNEESKCKVHSVAAHTLYEKSHPFYLPGPGGMLDLENCKFEQLTDRCVKVSGSKFIPSPVYTVKLEGAKPVGYRSIFIGIIRDPLMIGKIDMVTKGITQYVRQYFPDKKYEMIFHLGGKNGAMAELEPVKDFVPLEITVMLEVAAESQQLATAIVNRARVAMLHCPYPGRKSTAGNLAFPFTPLETPLGQVCKFNVYHIMEVDSPTELFPIKFLEV